MNVKEFLNEQKLSVLLHRLNRVGFSPRHLEITPVGSHYFGAAYNFLEDKVIEESVSAGFSSSPSLALLKSVVEMIERQAFIAGKEGGLSSCNTERSDGFAAYPTYGFPRFFAKRTARLNSFCEAVERYVWASWWDNFDYGHKIAPVRDGFSNAPALNFDVLVTHAPVKEVFLIEPRIDKSLKVSVKILLLELEDGGFVTGGAAGGTGKKFEESILARAYSELYRHALALQRFHDEPPVGQQDFYSQRLSFFGFGSGHDIVLNRIHQSGPKAISLPRLAVDEEIPHLHSSEVVVHRCLFARQPPFVGGDLERLCI